ncbi:MAG: hypothetical protein FH761_09050 [Firmicutes bacterium]|nr:hypothetical protein [Bacillota bacterium]
MVDNIYRVLPLITFLFVGGSVTLMTTKSFVTNIYGISSDDKKAYIEVMFVFIYFLLGAMIGRLMIYKLENSEFNISYLFIYLASFIFIMGSNIYYLIRISVKTSNKNRTYKNRIHIHTVVIAIVILIIGAMSISGIYFMVQEIYGEFGKYVGIVFVAVNFIFTITLYGLSREYYQISSLPMIWLIDSFNNPVSREGHILNISSDFIVFRPKDGDIEYINKSNIIKIFKKKPYKNNINILNRKTRINRKKI